MKAMNARGWVNLVPRLGSDDLEHQFEQFCIRLKTEALRSDGTLSSQSLSKFRRELSLMKTRPYSTEEIKFYLVCSIVLDLVAQTWKLRVTAEGVAVHAPLQQEQSPLLEKERVRKAHLVERDATLTKRTVTDFIRGMERRRLTAKGWHSIFSLMRDGRDLSARLNHLAQLASPEERVLNAGTVMAPYIQFVEGETTCDHTGLKLRDIWRYFRLTWVNEYKSIPGRSIMILIRDAAAPHHPVIGIAALGSAVVQQKARDELIGWDAHGFSSDLVKRPSLRTARQLQAALDHLIGGIYVKDLIEDNLLTRSQLKRPSDELIDALRAEGRAARVLHERNPHVAIHKSNAEDLTDPQKCKIKARTMLFRSKRCLQLAKLLGIKQCLQEHRVFSADKHELRSAVKLGRVRAAVGQLIRLIKAEHVGIDMMDITVCGAIAPYNVLLGGKLVCMLLGSPEVVNYYAHRYEGRPSIIASGMKGSPVYRRHNLVLLCTTSLYGVGSSQYNRVKVPAEALGGAAGQKFEYQKWGYSAGYGSFHFSHDTMNWIKFLLGRQGNRRVNSIFGEGVNPLMRKIRGALDSVGLISDELLLHGNERVVYGIPLASNYKEVLLGFAKRPKYIIPQTDAKSRTTMLFAYWCKRWLTLRIANPEIIKRVAEHTLSHPIQHGARVALRGADDDTIFLWDVLELDQTHPY
jgi:hypothetical protein